MRVFVVITLILLTISISIIAVQVYASTKFWMKSGEIRKTKTPDERLVNTEQAIGSLPFGGKELMQYYEQLTLLNNASAHAALAANQEEIFIYMVTVDTSSDWTEVILSEGPRIISYNYSLKGPTELRYSIRPGYIGLSKRAYDTTPVSVNMTLLALARATYIPKEIEEILEKNFHSYVTASVTKTHSYSRLLRKQNGMYVNPMVGDYIVIKEDDTTGSYLVSTSDLRKSSDRTITPLLIHLKIRGLKVEPRTVLKYLLDMQTLNIEGAYFPASVPWPLYRADKLCKKLYKITLYTRQLPSGKMLKVL
jgi:hypothetical protein